MGSRRARIAAAIIGAALGTSAVADAQAAVTIAGPAEVAESAGTAAYTLTRTPNGIGTFSAATAHVRVTGTAACPGDVVLATDPASCEADVTVPAAVIANATATVTLNVANDALTELPETATVEVVSVTNDTVGSPSSVTTTITDDDPLPSVAIADAPAVLEGDAAGALLQFPVTLSAVSGRPTTVQLAFAGSATKDADYVTDAGATSFTIPAGVTSATFKAAVAPDDLDEADEDLQVTISNSIGATLATGRTTGTGVITNDDLPALSVADVVLPEGSGTARTPFTFEVRLSNASTRTIAVTASTADLQAKAGQDYDATSERLSFPPGTTRQTITVPVIADRTTETGEAFLLNLSEPTGATLASQGALGGIIDDDKATTPGGSTSLPAPPTSGSGSVATGKLKLSTLTFARPATITGKLSCPSASRGCSGRLTLFSVPQRKSTVKALRKELKLGSASFKVVAGQVTALHVTLSKKNLAILRKGKRVQVKGYAVARNPAGEVSTAEAAGVIRP